MSMKEGRVQFKNVYTTQFKNDKKNIIIFEWNSNEGTRWISQKQCEEFKRLFEEEDSIKTAVNTGILHRDDVTEFIELMNSGKDKVVYREHLLRLRIQSVDFKWKKVSVSNFYDNSGNCIRYIVTLQDIHKFVLKFENMQYHAEFDTLTNIYKSEKFYELVSENLQNHPDVKYALIRLDIDRFKVINDMFGIEEGDRLLIYMSNIIRECYQPGYLYCRVNSDIFCMCVPYENKQEIITLIRELEMKIEHYRLNYKIVPAFGVYLIEERGVPVSVMLDWAKLASKSIKGSLFTNYAFYNNDLRDKLLQEIEIESIMSQALLEQQFKLFLQPKYDIATATIVGAEVLCRWQHPKKGYMAPSSFIPLFEKNGFIIQLDYYMWEETCRLVRRWLDEGKNVMTISMNVSRIHVYNPMFEKQIVQLMEKYQIPPNLLELELTESAFLENENEIYLVMERLRDKGFLFSIDDFGSGYSSLNMLKSVPIDIVKLDRGFLNETSVSRKGKAVIRYTIAMARQLNLKVIAEGVENVEQAAFLLKTGCSTAQGYYFCKPVPVDEFEQFAFADSEVAIVDASIQKVVSDKRDMLDEIRQIQNSDMLQDFFSNSAFTYDEMNNIQNNFIKIFKKYRAVLLEQNVIFYDFDLDRDKVITSYYDPEFEPDRKIKCYSDLVDFLLQICYQKDKDRLKQTLSLQNLQNLLDEKEGKIIVDYRINTQLREKVWIRTTIVLDVDNNGILDTLLLSSADIDELMHT